MEVSDLLKTIKQIEADHYQADQALSSFIDQVMLIRKTSDKNTHKQITALIDIYKHLQKIPKIKRNIVISSKNDGKDYHKIAKKYGISAKDADFIVADKSSLTSFINKYILLDSKSFKKLLVKQSVKRLLTRMLNL